MTDTPQAAQLLAAIPKAGAGRSRSKLKRAALGLIIVAGIFASTDYGRYYWNTGQYLISTDDAYVDVHSAIISPKVSGYIAAGPVNDNQPVKRGEIITRLHPRDYPTP